MNQNDNDDDDDIEKWAKERDHTILSIQSLYLHIFKLSNAMNVMIHFPSILNRPPPLVTSQWSLVVMACVCVCVWNFFIISKTNGRLFLLLWRETWPRKETTASSTCGWMPWCVGWIWMNEFFPNWKCRIFISREILWIVVGWEKRWT